MEINFSLLSRSTRTQIQIPLTQSLSFPLYHGWFGQDTRTHTHTLHIRNQRKKRKRPKLNFQFHSGYSDTLRAIQPCSINKYSLSHRIFFSIYFTNHVPEMFIFWKLSLWRLFKIRPNFVISLLWNYFPQPTFERVCLKFAPVVMLLW